MKLGLFLSPGGQHMAAWRAPFSRIGSALDLGYVAGLARLAEEGRFDFVFLADTDGMWRPEAERVARSPNSLGFEPLTLLSALAGATERIGLVASASTTYNTPFHVARQFASLDHLSGGRAGWNIVTSFMPHIAANFGREGLMGHDERYARAREFIEVVTGLWDSWDDGAVLADRETGRYLDPAKAHVLGHVGEHYSVRGPLPVARCPQGYPVLVQAGSSEAGKDLAARTAEVVFGVQPALADARAFYDDVKGRLGRHGRSPADIKLMPGAVVLVADDHAQAEQRFAELQEFVAAADGLSLMRAFGYPIDEKVQDLDAPLTDLPVSQGQQGRRQVLLDIARRGRLTIRELCRQLAVTRGHRLLLGSPREVADGLEEWFAAGAADGFNLMFTRMPEDLELFVGKVVPELQRRGLLRHEYEGRTLREHLGLRRPASRYDLSTASIGVAGAKQSHA